MHHKNQKQKDDYKLLVILNGIFIDQRNKLVLFLDFSSLLGPYLIFNVESEFK